MTPATNRQIPDHSIMDHYGKQVYLGNQFKLPIVAQALGSTSEISILLIQNIQSLTQVTQNQKAIFIDLKRFSSSAQAVLIKMYSNPTVSTTGTASVPINSRPANTNSSISKCYANGQFTTSANGTLMASLGIPTGYLTITDDRALIILDPGQSMLITATALVSTTVLNSEIGFYEI